MQPILLSATSQCHPHQALIVGELSFSPNLPLQHSLFVKRSLLYLVLCDTSQIHLDSHREYEGDNEASDLLNGAATCLMFCSNMVASSLNTLNSAIQPSILLLHQNFI